MDCLHNHKQGAEILTEHLAGTLDRDREAELERHAKDCPDCRRMLEVWDRLDEFPAPALSEDFDHRLYARIANEARMPWWRRMWLPTASLWRPLWRPVLPLATACAVLALALLVRNPDPNEGVKQVRIEQSGGPEIEQVVQALDDLELLSPVGSEPAGAI
ncbi:MAG TPA: zf-HC2 domain-containing protein [Bryobacteraceae bacterium]|nr:zf-HC2 domain-containing protein [Bryobacteraceae bacterium]